MPASITYESAETPQYLDPGSPTSRTTTTSCRTCTSRSSGTTRLRDVCDPVAGPELHVQLCGTLQLHPEERNYVRDGEPLNSTAVWFSINRAIINDGSTPVGHGTQSAWLIQQLMNQPQHVHQGRADLRQSYVREWLRRTSSRRRAAHLQRQRDESERRVPVPVRQSDGRPCGTRLCDAARPCHVDGVQRRIHVALIDAQRQLHHKDDPVLRRPLGDLQRRLHAGWMRSTYLDTQPGFHGRNRSLRHLTSNDTSTNTITLHGQPQVLGRPVPVLRGQEDSRADQDGRLQVRRRPDHQRDRPAERGQVRDRRWP